jgi:hypothetical protein
MAKEEYRVAFADIEDGFAKFVLYKNNDRKYFNHPLDQLPEGVNQDDLGDQFRPEFDDNGEIVALHHDEELTEQMNKEYDKAHEQFKEMREDN